VRIAKLNCYAKQPRFIGHQPGKVIIYEMLYLVNIPERSLAMPKRPYDKQPSSLHNHYKHLPLWQIILPVPQTSERGSLWAATTWASGIVYALGEINFLADKSFDPYMTMADVCTGFGVGQSTASAKAQVISRVLNAHQLNPKWSLLSLLEQNPLVWMAEVNGLLVDLRDMPREVQEIAFKKGMIFYCPADRGS
jgi:hypothetical protein